MKLTLEMPENAFSALRRTPDQFMVEMRHAACVKWYELGRLSQAKAAEISGLTRVEFIDLLKAYEVPAIQSTEDDLELEISR